MYQHLKSRNMLGPDEKAKLREQSYGFQWLWGGVPENVTLEDFSDTIMRTLIALIHTTAKTMSIALMDILSQHKHLDELRQEALDAQRSDGGINIDAPFKLDCFLKESQRLTPVFLCKSPNLHCTLEVIDHDNGSHRSNCHGFGRDSNDSMGTDSANSAKATDLAKAPSK
ncbi:hypothetical protein LTR47_010835 [Exophiala xenobiotica]|nr:hypothetical protein LTR92_010763 [Exophiala xenobiotica]KAK5221595.1 hypothetical protein LTR47_010835 [Exophiala xenobiotica]KAK5312191.1 hypothetical protein LTR93_011429 [Exophiala xenobiotica]KAK5345264.1 hypothetical protein LTR61_010985 [Exophiala xenobiotica]KAK5359986.1 hypothetical protein LTS03_010814 [Exophiala xenobiotica]